MRPNTGQPLTQQQHPATLQHHQQQQQYLDSNNHKHLPPPQSSTSSSAAAAAGVYVHQGLALPPQSSSAQQQSSSNSSHHHNVPGTSYSQNPHHQHPTPAGPHHPPHHYPPPHHHAGGHQMAAPPGPPHPMWNHAACYPGQNSTNPHMNVQNNRGQFQLGPPPPNSRHPYGPPPPQQHPGHLQNSQQHPSSQPHHLLHGAHGHGNYGSQGPAPIPGSHSERMPLTPPNYAKLPPLSAVNQQRINECAGIPLISTATAHLTPGQRQRISRKQSHSPPGKNWTHILGANNGNAQYAAAQFAAAHVQGAPLMIGSNKPTQQQQQQQKSMAEYWSSQNFKQRAGQPQGLHPPPPSTSSSSSSSSSFGKNDKLRAPLRYQNSAPAALSSSRSKENLVGQQLKSSQKEGENSSTSSSSSNSNAGDANGSSGGDTCLPRIIKPRKRRKKDRKPNNNLVNAVYLKVDGKLAQGSGAEVGGAGSQNSLAKNKSFKSSEDLLKCLEKFSQISNLQQEQGGERRRDIPSFQDRNSRDLEEIAAPTSPTSKTCHGGDLNHGICFCMECDPLKSIWDYPLRRSLSDSSSSSTSGTGSLSDNQASENDAPDNCWPKSRAEIVGVIGSKRIGNSHNNKNQMPLKPSNPEPLKDDLSLYNNNILGGINLSSDLFKSYGNANLKATAAAVSNAALEECLAATSPTALMLLPETAETLLTRSINEISKKLIETCSNEGNELVVLSSCNSLSSFSSASSSSSSSSSSANSSCGAVDFSSDSGIESAHINGGDDLVFNFDHLHIAKAAGHNTNNNNSSFSTKSSSVCGNNSSTSASSPTASKFVMATNFLTSPTMPAATPLSPSVLGVTTKSQSFVATTAPTNGGLESILLDLNNNQIPKEQKTMEESENQQQQQLLKFNGLAVPSSPSSSSPPPFTAAQTDQQQQFFSNCFELMWQQQQQHNKLANQHSEQLFALTSSTSTSTFVENVGSLKTVFSTIS